MHFSPLKKLQHVLEWAVLKLLFGFCHLVGLNRASNTLGAIGRTFGPHLSKSKVARRNLHMVFPEWNDEQIEEVVADMWDNMARNMAELPCITPMTPQEFREIAEIHGEEHLLAAKSQDGSLFFSAHMANWELGAKASWACGVRFAVVFRPLNNPLADNLANNLRDQYQLRGLAKSATGSRELIKTLRDGDPVAILIDQKMNTGVPVSFFGHPAMTSTAITDLAVKYGYPIIPTRVERLGNAAKFRITFHPPVHWEPTGNNKADAVMLMEKLHHFMEGWIRERPGQWFWVHKRWG